MRGRSAILDHGARGGVTPVRRAPGRSSATPSRRATRRGVTFLEVVFATAMLAVVATAVFSALSFVTSTQERQQRRLAAAELCNRLLLMYLDEEQSMPSTLDSLEYDGDRYRWELREEPVQVEYAKRNDRPSTSTVDQMTQLRLVTVQVWLAEESGGARSGREGAPGAVVARLFNPVAIYRNPDSAQNAVSTDEGRRRWVTRFLESGGGAPKAPPKGTPTPGSSGTGGGGER